MNTSTLISSGVSVTAAAMEMSSHTGGSPAVAMETGGSAGGGFAACCGEVTSPTAMETGALGSVDTYNNGQPANTAGTTAGSSSVDCPLVFFDIRIGDEQVGRIVLELWQHLFANTVRNFIALATGTAIGSSGRPLTYQGTRIHKIISHCAIQGGDAINNDGTGSDSIFGVHFPHEGPWLKHDQVGLLGMVSSGGPNTTNGCQWYITTADNCSHLNGRHTVFGRVIRGIGVVRQIECVNIHNDIPLEDTVIESCGLYQPGMPLGPEDPFGDDIFPPFPDDCPSNFINFRSLQDVTHVAERVKLVGNYYYKREQYVKANAKYKKALRYLSKYQERSEELTSTEEAALTQAVLPHLLNSAACKIKLKQYDQALEDCNEALDMVPNHPKALYRRGQAYHGKRDYDRAIADLVISQQLAPTDRSVVAELKACRGEMATYCERERPVSRKQCTPKSVVQGASTTSSAKVD